MSQNNNARYIKNYLKHNGIVLICELLIVLLLSIICTILLGGSPKWLAPVLAVAAYLLAELRFMMAYMAKCVKRDRMMREQQLAADDDENAEIEGDEIPAESDEEVEEVADDEDVEFSPFIPDEEDEEEEDISDFAEEDDEDLIPFDAGEDEVSDVTEDDEDIDTFDDDTRK